MGCGCVPGMCYVEYNIMRAATTQLATFPLYDFVTALLVYMTTYLTQQQCVTLMHAAIPLKVD